MTPSLQGAYHHYTWQLYTTNTTPYTEICGATLIVTWATSSVLPVNQWKKLFASAVHFPSEEYSCDGRISHKKHSNAYKLNETYQTTSTYQQTLKRLQSHT